MERAAALAISNAATTPAAAERVAALGRTIALLEQHDWQIILETKDAGDAGLALSAIEASRRGRERGAVAAASRPPTTAATSAAPAAKTKQHVRLEVSAGTLLDKETVARLIALDVIASTPKPIASLAARRGAPYRRRLRSPATPKAMLETGTAAAPLTVIREPRETWCRSPRKTRRCSKR